MENLFFTFTRSSPALQDFAGIAPQELSKAMGAKNKKKNVKRKGIFWEPVGSAQDARSQCCQNNLMIIWSGVLLWNMSFHTLAFSKYNGMIVALNKELLLSDNEGEDTGVAEEL